jgi:hypothetical protein
MFLSVCADYRNNLIRFASLFLVVFVTGCSGQKAVTIVRVIQNAERLEGKSIRVRGCDYLWKNPSRATMWLYGGCTAKLDPNERQGSVKGWLTLYDLTYPDEWGGDGAPHNETGIKISESSFSCEGDYCKITCSPFEVGTQRTYEFVGTLQVNQNSEFILEDIDLEQSHQLVDGNWVPIQKVNLDIRFP